MDLLNTDIELLQKEIKDLADQRIKLNEFWTAKKKLLVEKEKMKEQYEIDTFINTIFEYVNGMDGSFASLMQSELEIIAKGIDKTNYILYGQSRWMDLETILKNVIKIKTKYPQWQLAYLVKTFQEDSLPPKNYYEYGFNTNDDVLRMFYYAPND